MILRILLVEPDPEETLMLREVLNEMDSAACWSDWVHLETLHASTLSDATAVLASERVDLVLLDLSVPDCPTAAAYRRLQAVTPDVPMILLVEPGEITLAEQLVREGAQDFLIRQRVDCVPLAHAIRNAVGRHRLLNAVRATSTTDQLTGLLNHSTFMTLADRDRKLAERLRCRLTVLVAEPVHLEALASAYGEQRRDLSMVETAEQLRTLASPADLVGRIGAGRFGLTIFETTAESAEDVWARLHGAAAQNNMCVGMAVFDPARPLSLEVLLERAALDLMPETAAAGR